MRSQSRVFEKAVGFRAKIKICDNPLKILICGNLWINYNLWINNSQ